MKIWVQRLHSAEDALLVGLLSCMILLAALQIVLRNFFEAGIVWIDPLLRVGVLWLGLIGATVATRHNKHIRIDILSKAFSRNANRLIQAVVGQVSAWTCLVIAWFGMRWIQLDYEDGFIAFAGIPAWILEIIIPLTFALIGVRYLLMSYANAVLYWRHRKVAARNSR